MGCRISFSRSLTFVVTERQRLEDLRRRVRPLRLTLRPDGKVDICGFGAPQGLTLDEADRRFATRRDVEALRRDAMGMHGAEIAGMVARRK
jgi:hypothetical protein